MITPDAGTAVLVAGMAVGRDGVVVAAATVGVGEIGVAVGSAVRGRQAAAPATTAVARRVALKSDLTSTGCDPLQEGRHRLEDRLSQSTGDQFDRERGGAVALV